MARPRRRRPLPLNAAVARMYGADVADELERRHAAEELAGSDLGEVASLLERVSRGGPYAHLLAALADLGVWPADRILEVGRLIEARRGGAP